MNDLDLSHMLALAIGWKPRQVKKSADRVVLQESAGAATREFDYRDPSVYEALMREHGLSPVWSVDHKKWVLASLPGTQATKRPLIYADSPAKLVALHVLATKMQGTELRALVTSRSSDFYEGTKTAFELLKVVAQSTPAKASTMTKEATKLAMSWVQEAQQILSAR